jgi:hypothetical protein
MHSIHQLWSTSRSFRILLIAALSYAFLRLLVQVAYISGLLITGDQTNLATPADLAVYIDAAQHIQQGQPLYLDPATAVKSAFPYLYSPTFALVFGWLFLWLQPIAIALVHTALHIAAYLALYVLWDRLLRQAHQLEAAMLLAYTLPLWLICAPFWSDMLLLNVRVFISLLVVALIAALLAERLRAAVVLLVLILLLKPQWACVLSLPLLLGQWRFARKLGALSAAAYATISALTILALGPAYGLQQYHDYARLLTHVGNVFPWDIARAGIIGPNHSLAQIAVYALGATPAAFRIAAVLKLVLLLPLVALALRYYRNNRSPADAPGIALDVALVLCLSGYIVLDLVWADDFFLGVMIVPYLVSTRLLGARLWLWPVFMLYALVDFLRLAGFAVLGPNVMIATPYMELARTDPSIYAPLAMILILACYGLLLVRLWAHKPIAQSTGKSVDPGLDSTRSSPPRHPVSLDDTKAW